MLDDVFSFFYSVFVQYWCMPNQTKRKTEQNRESNGMKRMKIYMMSVFLSFSLSLNIIIIMCLLWAIILINFSISLSHSLSLYFVILHPEYKGKFFSAYKKFVEKKNSTKKNGFHFHYCYYLG